MQMKGKAQRGLERRMRVIVFERAKKPEETQVKQPLKKTSCVFNNAIPYAGCSHLLLLLIRCRWFIERRVRRATRQSQVYSICVSLPLRCKLRASITQIIILLLLFMFPCCILLMQQNPTVHLLSVPGPFLLSPKSASRLTPPPCEESHAEIT